jgi:predicted acyl esterase
VYEWRIDLWATSNVFKKDHRIRVDVSSSFFPFFGRNHNTGNPPAQDVEFVIAQQTLHHSSHYPSHIVLPIVPAEAEPETEQ